MGCIPFKFVKGGVEQLEKNRARKKWRETSHTSFRQQCFYNIIINKALILSEVLGLTILRFLNYRLNV